jgi:hypothetical protein
MAFYYDAPLPRPGLPVRMQLTGIQWLLECEGTSCRVVAIGREILYQARVALPREGQLSLHCKAPSLPIQLGLAQPLVLAPGCSMQGWLALPLSQSLLFKDAAGEWHELVALEDPTLGTGWREEGGYFHVWKTKLEDRPRRMDDDEGLRFWIRLRITNPGPSVQRLESLLLPLGDHEIWSVRGGVPIGPSARLRLNPGEPELKWRDLPLLRRVDLLQQRYGAEELR